MSTQDQSPSPLVFAVTPHASNNFSQEVRQLYVGTAGNVAVVNIDDSVVTFSNVNAGSTLGPFYIKRVNAVGTTASNIVAFN
jgi:hypothetical protein